MIHILSIATIYTVRKFALSSPESFFFLSPIQPPPASAISGFNQPLSVQMESYVQPGNLRMTTSPGPPYSILGLSALARLVQFFFLCVLWQVGALNEKTI